MSGKIEKEDKFLLDSTRDEQAIKEFKMKAYKKTGIIQWYLKRDEDEEERIRLEIVPEKTGMRHVWTQAKKEHRSDLRDRLESEYSLDPTEVDLKNLETLPFVVKIRHYLEPKNKGIKEVIDVLEPNLNVYISSESALPEEFSKYKLKIEAENIHHFLNFAHLFIGDSQSMSIEAALLGTYTIRFTGFAGRISVMKIFENIGLIRSIPSDNPNELLETLAEIKDIEKLKTKAIQLRR